VNLIGKAHGKGPVWNKLGCKDNIKTDVTQIRYEIVHPFFWLRLRISGRLFNTVNEASGK
jgi:hypothetical protein